MKIKPVLGFNKYKSKDGTFPIYIKVNIGQKRTLIPVGAKIKPGQWDPGICRVKVGSHPNATQINLNIIDLLSSIEKNNLKGETDPTMLGDIDNFYWWFEERIRHAGKEQSTYNEDKLKAVRNKLLAYAPTLKVKDVDFMFLTRYGQHLRSIGNSHNTVADNLLRIRIIVNMILKSRKFPEYPDPYHGLEMKTTRVKKNRVNIQFIDKLAVVPLDRYPQQELAVDMYLYSFFNAGIRFGDLTRLRVSDVQDGRLRYRMHKTEIDRNILQVPQAMRIYKKHAAGKKPGDRLFSTGVKWRRKETRDDIRKEDKSINAKNTLLNKHLKKICEALEGPPLTFHTSRHSFADYTKQKKFDGKFDFHTLKDLFGHKRPETTQSYMQDFYEEESDKAMEQLFGSPQRQPARRSKSRERG